VITCSRCGTQNPDTARFCMACGERLVADAAGEERKIVTVLFCDLVGFTERSDHADPEDVKARLSVYHATLKDVIERFGGTVDKFIGDAVLGVFGAPVGHEDDPERAVRAALRIQAAIAEMDAARPELGLEVRAGINTGEAIVAFGLGPQIGESLTGDVVNTASRLQAVAPPGGIVVGEPTFRATRGGFLYEELDPVRVKGKAEPLTIWRPIAPRSRLDVDVTARPSGSFVGRRTESDVLRDRFEAILAAPGGRVELVSIVGDPGVGKSRLIRELAGFVDALPDFVNWRQGRCLPYGEGVSFWALGEIVKGEAGILDSDPPPEAAAKLEVAIEAVAHDRGQRDWLRKHLSTLIGLGTEDLDPRGDERTTAWRRFVEALAERRPTVLVFEDLHWADTALLRFIEDLADSPTPGRLLIVCAARPELAERAPAFGRGREHATTVPLGPLSDAETALLLAQLLDRAVLPAQTQAVLLERCAGNPLYAEEFVQMLIDRGLIDRGRERLPAADLVPVPDTIQALLASRLDALPVDVKALIHDAAVLGKVFWSGALALMSGLREEEVRALLDEAERRELVRPSRTSSLSGQREYTFWHLLIRDVAYGQIPRAARGVKHLAAARWLKATLAGRLQDFAEELAHHYLEALEYGRTSGGEGLGELRADTATALYLAADRVWPLDAARADTYLAQAVELMADGHPMRPRTLSRAADVASLRGRHDEAVDRFEEAIAGFQAAGDRHGEGEALGLLARVLSRRGELARSDELMEASIALLEADPPSPELVRIYNRKAGGLLTATAYEDCLALTERALALAEELGLDDEYVRALQFRGAARCETGDEGGLDDLRLAIERGRSAGHGQSLGLALGNYAFELWFREGPAEALGAWREMRRLAEGRGFLSQLQQARMGELECLFDLGEWDDVMRIANAMWRHAEDRRSEIGVYAQLFAAWVRLRRGEYERVRARIDRLLDDARRLGLVEYLVPAIVCAAEVRRLSSDAAGARTLLVEFGERTAAEPRSRALFLPIVARGLAALGEPATIGRLIPAPEVVRTPRHRHGVVTALAIQAEAEGRIEEALVRYRDASLRWDVMGFTLEQGLTRLGQARCLIALGRVDDADRPLLEARLRFERLGASEPLSEVAALQAADDSISAV
jgi:class 3 adenylate cyclase/tetratricopeptide (TPR) repeat protein